MNATTEHDDPPVDDVGGEEPLSPDELYEDYADWEYEP